MWRYILRRLVGTVIVIFGVTLTVFFLMRFVPGDPVDIMLGGEGLHDPDLAAKYRQEYGLDQPIPIQYARWMAKLFAGDLGRSIAFGGEPVTDLLSRRLRNTMILAVAGAMVAVVGAVILGVLGAIVAAEEKSPVLDRLLGLGPLLLTSIPAFALGIGLIVLFASKLRVLPAVGMHDVTGGGTLDLLKHLILPAFTLAASSLGANARLTRATVLEVLREDYIRLARAKGLPERLVLYEHALRNAMIPVITSLGLMFGYMLAGSVIVESVFAWPGLGQMVVDALLQRDYPVIQGGILVIAIVFVFINLVVDISYAYIDPRIRHGGAY